jgi:hypothetical protein
LAESGDPLPASFSISPTFTAHGILAALLAGSIAAHVAAALYHQLVRKDRLFGWLLFGRRGVGPGRQKSPAPVGVAPGRCVVAGLPDLMTGRNGGRVMAAMTKTQKVDVQALEDAAAG